MRTVSGQKITGLQHGSHICLVSHNNSEQINAAIPFLEEGLERGECCVYIGDKAMFGSVSSKISRTGKGELVFLSNDELPVQNGNFQPEVFASFIRDKFELLHRGYPAVRSATDMTWTLQYRPVPQGLVRFEALATELCVKSRGLFMCQYNRSLLPEQFIRGALRTHPVAIVGNRVVSNNFYFQATSSILTHEEGAEALESMLTHLEQESGREEDLATERTLRTHAEDVNRRRDVFLASLSHELRTSLTNILGWCHVLNGGRLDEAGTVRALASIERSARAQFKIVEELYDISRAEAGKLSLEMQSIDIPGVCEELAGSLNAMALEHGLTGFIEVQPGVGGITADPARLRQILWNLVTNSIKFTPNGGRIEVVMRRQDTWLEIIVRDSGIGIKPDMLPKIFDQFYQAKNGGSWNPGLGLGLGIAKRMVEVHQGTISAQSPGENQGATFTVRLPYKPSDLSGDVLLYPWKRSIGGG